MMPYMEFIVGIITGILIWQTIEFLIYACSCFKNKNIEEAKNNVLILTAFVPIIVIGFILILLKAVYEIFQEYKKEEPRGNIK